MKKIVVIGGGPAGMMAAATAARQGESEVILLEKNHRLGKKLSITGKGRCNITSAEGDMEQFIANYPGNGRFLYSSLHELSNQDLINFFNQRGLKTKVERGKRVFPVSDDADEVVNVLKEELRKNKVKVKTGQRVEKIIIRQNWIKGVQTESEIIGCDAVIIATGGMSYPGTGSTGDGYQWAEDAGHKIITPRPGLVPLVAKEGWIKDLQGLSLKNVKAMAYQSGSKKINEDFGELLFTHFGLSGPIILSMSRDIGDYIYKKQQPVHLFIDLKPALDEEKLDKRIIRDLTNYSRKQFKNSLGDLLPQKLIPVIIKLCGIDENKESNQISKNERAKLVSILKRLPVTITATRSLAEAIVTAGGVDVKEVNPKTMQSKLVQGLFFAGEVIDIDGYTGGFNLQAAFATGFVAGKYASKINA